jgi:hypothetical protein
MNAEISGLSLSSNRLRLLPLAILFCFLMSCARSGSGPEVEPIPDPEISAEYLGAPELAWNKTSLPVPQKWSQYLLQVIDQEAPQILEKAKDAERFCANYENLERQQKLQFWGELMVAISYFESSYRPTVRYNETTQTNDSVTGLTKQSEGLFQLSYSDRVWMPQCQFDWGRDSALSSTDERKSILNPYINMHCAVHIMNRQIKRSGKVILSKGVYWSVIREGGAYSKITKIQKIIGDQLLFCEKEN